MTDNDLLIEKLKEAVTTTLGRTLDSPTDFNYLSTKIFDHTGDMISASTLKRLFGYIKPSTTARPSTLSALARYVGYAGWSEFCAAQSTPAPSTHKSRSSRTGLYIVLTLIVLSVIATVVWMITWTTPAIEVPKPVTIDTVKQSEPTPQKDELLSEQQKYEGVLRYCIRKTDQAFKTARAKKSQMDVRQYSNYINDFYSQYIFNDLKSIINKAITKAFPDDDLLQRRYADDIFVQCREIGVDRLREAALEIQAAQK